MRSVYPWAAVVGQEQLKHALVLCAIDPAIGGVLLSGPRGVAKTTLARALGELIAGAFVELPLGASDDRVTGTLDLASALEGGALRFSPGLLARAHGGVLYVDEVNLLPDALVDLLLDAAGSGQNVVERDGVSHQHPARFVLIGTMNPEEGELRPQLTDRFGLSVRAEPRIAPAERAEIVARRLAFDADPARFGDRFAAEQAALIARCQRARERAARMSFGEEAPARVSELCFAAQVEGVRADLAMLRAARAHAAWHDREQITAADVDAVAELALAHRRGEPSPEGGGAAGPQEPRGGPAGRGATQHDPGSVAREGASSTHAPQASSHAALAPVPVRTAAIPVLPSFLRDTPARRAERRRRAQRQAQHQAGASRGPAVTHDAPAVAWFASLRAAARRRAARLGVVDLRYRARKAPAMQHWVLALDCSASMLRHGSLSAAKALAQAFERNAHRVGAHLSLLSFRGASTQLEAGSAAARATRSRALRELGAGGATPLREALRESLALVQRRPFGSRDVGKRLLMLTDGRTRESLGALRRELHVRASRDLQLVIVDCERGPVRLGRAQAIAEALHAQYLHIDTLPPAPG